jgi:hypothetical protein
LYAIERMGPEEAIREVRRVRPIALSAEGWEPFAHEVLERLRLSRRNPRQAPGHVSAG